MLTFVVVLTLTIGKFETSYTFKTKERYHYADQCEQAAVNMSIELIEFATALGAEGVTSRKCFIPDYRDT